MKTRSTQPLAVAAAAWALAACTDSAPPQNSEAALLARAHAIHTSVLTVDTHDDISFEFATEAVDPLNADRQVTLEGMRAGGLDAEFFVVYVGQTERTAENYAEARANAMLKFDAIHRMAEEMYPAQIELAYSADDVERIHESDRLVAVIGIENGYVIGHDPSLLERYHALGARYMTLAHNGHNDIADSAQPRPDIGDVAAEHGGVSAYGADVIQEMNRLGIMVDVSHISKAAALDAMRLSRAPVIASHSGMRALTDHVRNLDDQTLLALQADGGVVQAVAFADYVKTLTPEQEEALDALLTEFRIERLRDWHDLTAEQREQMRTRLAGLGYADVSDLVDHIDYAVDLIGIDHVGISSDFDGGGGVVGWFDASETFNVTLELVRRGYTEPDIRQLWGGNLLRVWREAERIAAQSAR
jgi:membrane dipeptidase